MEPHGALHELVKAIFRKASERNVTRGSSRDRLVAYRMVTRDTANTRLRPPGLLSGDD
jgi:hypothetical protein